MVDDSKLPSPVGCPTPQPVVPVERMLVFMCTRVVSRSVEAVGLRRMGAWIRACVRRQGVSLDDEALPEQSNGRAMGYTMPLWPRSIDRNPPNAQPGIRLMGRGWLGVIGGSCIALRIDGSTAPNMASRCRRQVPRRPRRPHRRLSLEGTAESSKHPLESEHAPACGLKRSNPQTSTGSTHRRGAAAIDGGAAGLKGKSLGAD